MSLREIESRVFHTFNTAKDLRDFLTSQWTDTELETIYLSDGRNDEWTALHVETEVLSDGSKVTNIVFAD